MVVAHQYSAVDVRGEVSVVGRQKVNDLQEQSKTEFF